MKCKCGNNITGYDRYLLGDDTDICVECTDEKQEQLFKDRFIRDKRRRLTRRIV